MTSWILNQNVFDRPVWDSGQRSQSALRIAVVFLSGVVFAWITMPTLGANIIRKRGWEDTPLWFHGLWVWGMLPYFLLLPTVAMFIIPHRHRAPKWLVNGVFALCLVWLVMAFTLFGGGHNRAICLFSYTPSLILQFVTPEEVTLACPPATMPDWLPEWFNEPIITLLRQHGVEFPQE